MTDKIVVFVTTSNAREAKAIARRLIGSKLAACVNVTQPNRSIYRWKGKIEEARETLLIIKTRRDLFEEIKAAILGVHTYEVPEIICLPIVDGSTEYLSWIDGSLKTPAQRPGS